MGKDHSLRAERAINHNSIHVFSDQSILRNIGPFNPTITVATSVNWEAANRVYYVPFWIAAPFNIGKLVWMNGSAVAGNVQMGVYNAAGTLLCTTGTVAQSGTTQPQGAAPTAATVLLPDRYYWGITMSTTTNARIERFNLTTLPTPFTRLSGFLRESADPGAFGLPSTATFAQFTGQIPMLAMWEDISIAF